jgi:formylglycine-generating enzyme required for sulfatase activity
LNSRIVLVTSLVLLLWSECTHAQIAILDTEYLRKGVVRITAAPPGQNQKVGTGFIVQLEKDLVYIVTAAHVVEGDSQPKVQFFTQEDVSVQATVRHSEGDDEVTGLALLVVRGKDNLPSGLTVLTLASASRLSGNEEIVVIGHPRGAGDWAILKGGIASRQGRYMTIDANIDEGNSGGPIIHSGEVVGLIGGVTRYGRGVTAGSVREYLEGHGIDTRAAPPEAVARVQPIPSIPIKPEKSHPAFDREITGKDGAPMVLIPAGEFWMGSPDGEGDNDEHPRHKVALSAFYLAKYEVTNQRFEQFAQQTSYRTTAEQEGKAWAITAIGKPEEVSGAHWRKPEGGATVFDSNREEHPVVSVSWEDAQAYCRWAGKRLPTEAEFEYATRAGAETKYWWGNGNPGSRRVANIGDESLKRQYSDWPLPIMTGYDDGSVRTAPVGSFEANPFGLYDMTGNVWEWTSDRYDKQYYGNSPRKDPMGQSNGDFRVLRGGSWTNSPDEVRSANRTRHSPTYRFGPFGFRCAQDSSK